LSTLSNDDEHSTNSSTRVGAWRCQPEAMANNTRSASTVYSTTRCEVKRLRPDRLIIVANASHDGAGERVGAALGYG